MDAGVTAAAGAPVDVDPSGLPLDESIAESIAGTIAEPDPEPATRGLISRCLEHGWWPIILWSIGLLMGGRALSDNSFLTHLATGRLIRTVGAPHADVYTFGSRGTHLVVQSWLASWTYATLEALGGAGAIRVFIAVVTGLLMVMLWRLSAPAGALLARLALVAMAGMVGMLWWNERPQIIAFVLLAAIALVISERRSPWWLALLFGLWVNVHGSFPLGLVYLALALGVSALAERRVTKRSVLMAAAAVSGVVLGASVSPYGFELLTFPFALARRSSQLILISEWRPLALDSMESYVFLAEVCAIGGLLLMQRAWTRLAMAAVFVALALVAVRNVAVASLVLVPIAAPSLMGLGEFQPGRRPSRRSWLTAGSVALAVTIGWAVATPDYDFSPYPVAAVTWMEREGLAGNLDARVLTHDYDGAYLEWRYGDRANAWIDDRAEVHSFEATRDYVFLLSDIGDPAAILAAHPHEVLLWERDSSLARFVEQSADYRIVYRDRAAIVACRRDSGVVCPADVPG